MNTAVLEKTADTKTPASLAQNIPLALIRPSSTNRAAEVNAEFIDSIRQHGVIQPIVLRPVIASTVDKTIQPNAPFQIGDTIYEVVSGERRFLGSQAAQKTSIPAIVRHLTDAEAMELQIIENDQREDLSPMDRAQAYSRLKAQYLELHAGEKGYTETSAMDEVAQKVSRQSRTIYQVIQLGKLTWQLQAALRQEEMLTSHAYEICRRPEDEQIELLAWIRKETQHSQGDIPSVRRLKDQVRKVEAAADDKRRQEKLPLDPPPFAGDGMKAALTSFVAHGQNAQSAVDKAIKEAEGIPALQGKIKAFNPPPQKVPTPAELRKIEKKREEERQTLERDRQKAELSERVVRRYDAMFFAAFAGKVKISSRLLSHVVPRMMVEAFDCGLQVSSYAQDALGWPAPEDGSYTRDEVRTFSKKHYRKYTPALFAALSSLLLMTTLESEQLARYYGVDAKKLRAKAAAAVKAEEKAKVQTSAKKDEWNGSQKTNPYRKLPVSKKAVR